MRLKKEPRLRFAGQITGVEGYVESASMGILAGRFAAAERLGTLPSKPPRNSALGALLAHITGEANAETFQPMNVNFGLFSEVEVPVDEDGKRPRGKAKGPARKRAYTSRALRETDEWLARTSFAAE